MKHFFLSSQNNEPVPKSSLEFGAGVLGHPLALLMIGLIIWWIAHGFIERRTS